MLKKNFIFFILLAILFSCNYKKENLPKKQVLFWDYSDSINAKVWDPAKTPGSIHIALANNLFLAKNFYFDHYTKKIAWLSHKNWFYKTSFNLDEQTYKNKQIWLLFPGLDTYTRIYINGKQIAQTNDFFKSYYFDIKKYLKPGKNQIIVQFYPPIEKTKQFYKSLKLKTHYNPLSILRKPYFHFNDDLGANYIPIGFSYQPQIMLWEKAFIKDTRFTFNNITKKSAQAIATITIYSSQIQTVNIQIKSQFKIHLAKKIKLKPGKNTFTFKFTINNPHLWYPYSKPNQQPEVYKFTTTLHIKTTKYSEFITYSGIRSVKITTAGKKLHVKINDTIVQLKAAQIFPLRVNISEEDQLYLQFIRLLKNAGFNAVVTSDKGWYHYNRFYTLCDQEGIMVIQTLPIAYKAFPPADTVVNIILDETKQNILHLYNHPSIIAWNANFNPGKVHFPDKNSKKFSISFFTQILPTLIKSIDSTRPYLTSLNFINITHIKHNFISLPNTSLVYNFFDLQNQQRDLDLTLSFFTKPKPQLFFPLKKLVEKFYSTDSLNNFYYFSQIIQKQKFQNYLQKQTNISNGHIIVHWFNDITPALSPAFIDYSLKPKAKYYILKQYLSDFQIQTKNNGNNVQVTLISSLDTAHVLAYYKLYDFYGHLLWQKVQKEKLINHTVTQVFDLGIYYKLFTKDSILMKIEIYNNLELVAEKYHYFIDQTKIRLLDPGLKILYYPVDEGFAIELTAQNYLAKDIQIIPTLNGSMVDNNYFDLLPGESKVVVIYLPIQTDNFASLIRVFSKYDYITGRNNNRFYKFNIQQKNFQQLNE